MKPAREGRQCYSVFMLQGSSVGAKCKTKVAGAGERGGGKETQHQRSQMEGMKGKSGKAKLGHCTCISARRAWGSLFKEPGSIRAASRCRELEPLTYGLLPTMETHGVSSCQEDLLSVGCIRGS